MSWALLAFGDQFLLAFHDMEFAGNYRSLSVLLSPKQCNFTGSNRFQPSIFHNEFYMSTLNVLFKKERTFKTRAWHGPTYIF